VTLKYFVTSTDYEALEDDKTCGMQRRVVSWKWTDISEVRTASIIMGITPFFRQILDLSFSRIIQVV
jgi:hypothetical protein